MNISSITRSELGGIFTQHHDSLPHWQDRGGDLHPWPWVLEFIGLPAAFAVSIAVAGFAPSGGAVAGLLAGAGILGGLLFQVLANVSGRIAALADTIGDDGPTDLQLGLINRLDIARANIAYATFVSIAFVLVLGIQSMLKHTPDWVLGVSAFLLVHLTFTLVLVLVRINQIAQDDRVSALTARARARSQG